MEEIWKSIEGYEGLYEVSNLGRVKSLDRMCWNGHIWWKKKGELLSNCVDSGGYHYVGLCVNGKHKNFLIHKLVMSAFVGEPPIDKPEINHIDEDKSNNCLSNLHYCDRKFNANYSYTWKKAIDVCKKPVLQFTKDGRFVAEYESAAEAAREIGKKRSNISACCLGKKRCKSVGGYIWKYKEDV